MVGHDPIVDKNNFAANPFIIYVNGGGTQEAFNKPYARIIMLDDFTGWSGDRNALKNIATGVGVSGFPIKGGMISNVPALPCVIIENKIEKYLEMQENPEFKLDCIWWDVDEPIYPPFYETRRFIRVSMSGQKNAEPPLLPQKRVNVDGPRLKKRKKPSDEKLIEILSGKRRVPSALE